MRYHGVSEVLQGVSCHLGDYSRRSRCFKAIHGVSESFKGLLENFTDHLVNFKGLAGRVLETYQGVSGILGCFLRAFEDFRGFCRLSDEFLGAFKQIL